jgi:hypothetical protein
VIPVSEREDAVVAVVVPSQVLARYVMFEMSLEGLWLPKDSNLMRTTTGNAARGRNQAIREADPATTHFFFLDDDHQFDPDILIRLLNDRQPIVCALNNWKIPPFTPIVFYGENVDEVTGNKKLLTYPLVDLQGVTGVHPVFAAAGSGLLVEAHVFKALPEPWFQVGRFNPEEMSEDLWFYEQARNAGYSPTVDFDVQMAHITPVAVKLERGEKGVWHAVVIWENRKRVVLTLSGVKS